MRAIAALDEKAAGVGSDRFQRSIVPGAIASLHIEPMQRDRTGVVAAISKRSP